MALAFGSLPKEACRCCLTANVKDRFLLRLHSTYWRVHKLQSMISRIPMAKLPGKLALQQNYLPLQV